MTENRRRSMLDSTRNNNFLRKSFGMASQPSVLTREDYLLVLRREQEMWRRLLKDKKKVVMRKRSEMLIRREDVLTSLSEDDRAFRNDRPNYPEILQFARSYIHSIRCHRRLASDFNERYDTLVEDIADEIDKIVDKLLTEENELCMICNNGCTKELHPLQQLNDLPSSLIISEMVNLQLQDC